MTHRWAKDIERARTLIDNIDRHLSDMTANPSYEKLHSSDARNAVSALHITSEHLLFDLDDNMARILKEEAAAKAQLKQV